MWKMLTIFRFVVSKACQRLLCSRIICQFNETITSLKTCHHGYNSSITENLKVYLVVSSHYLWCVTTTFWKRAVAVGKHSTQVLNKNLAKVPSPGTFLSPCTAFSSSPLHVSVFRLLIQYKILHLKSDATCYLSRIYNIRQKACTRS